MISEPILTIQGGVTRFQQPSSAPKRPPALRGRVSVFTEAARRRLCQTFASVDLEQLSEGGAVLFLTLTMTPEYWQRPLVVYRALRRLRARLSRRYPDAAGIWRREVGDGGNLHYHAVIFNVDFIPAGWLRHAWRECLGMTVLPRVHIERVRGDRVCRYVAKYASKAAHEGREDGQGPRLGSGADAGAPDGERGGGLSLSETHNCTQDGNVAENTGADGVSGTRWWYVWNRDKVPFADEIVISVGADAREVAKRVRRVLSRWLQRRAAGKYGLRRVISARFAGWLGHQRGGWMVFLPPELEFRIVTWAVSAEASA